MEISFSTHLEVQIILISGRLGQAEGAAVRNKLSEKINQGRNKVLFELSTYDLSDNTARTQVISAILYAMNRDVTVACAHSDLALWPFLVLPSGNKTLKIFLSREEALSFLDSQNSPKLKSSAQGTKSKTEAEINEEFKSKALKILLEKYSIFQTSDLDDPLRLEFFAAEYLKSGRGDIFDAEKKASELLVKTDNELAELELNCSRLAGEVKRASLNRKIPFDEKELMLKRDTFNQTISELGKKIQMYNSDIEKYSSDTQELKNELINLKTERDLDETSLTQKLSKLKIETEALLQNLKSKDDAEEKNLLEKKSSSSKP